MTQQEVQALFLLAGYDTPSFYSIINSNNSINSALPKSSPWWLVKLPEGLVKLGWDSNRFISIDWSDTSYRGKVLDGVTSFDNTHARVVDHGQAVSFLAELRACLRRSQYSVIKASNDQVKKCTAVRRQMGEAYPKTCEFCGLGPCKVSATAAEDFLAYHTPTKLDPATTVLNVGTDPEMDKE